MALDVGTAQNVTNRSKQQGERFRWKLSRRQARLQALQLAEVDLHSTTPSWRRKLDTSG